MVLLIRGIVFPNQDPSNACVGIVRIACISKEDPVGVEGPHHNIDVAQKSPTEWIICDTRQIPDSFYVPGTLGRLEKLISLLIPVIQRDIGIQWPVSLPMDDR